MKLLTFKTTPKEMGNKYTLLLINDDGVKIKVDTEYLPKSILEKWENIQDYFNDLIYYKEQKRNLLILQGFNIKLGTPEMITFDVLYGCGGMEYKAKSEALNVDLMYEGKDKYATIFIGLYDYIKVDFADLIVENFELITKWDGGQMPLFTQKEASHFEEIDIQGTNFKQILKKV